MFFDKNYLRNLGWQGMGNVSAQIVNVVSLPIITRLFTPADIGMLRVFIEALAFTTILISFRVEHIIMLPKRKNDAVEQSLRKLIHCYTHPIEQRNHRRVVLVDLFISLCTYIVFYQ